MESESLQIGIKYCCKHGRDVLGEIDSLNRFRHFGEIGGLPCYGPFAEVPPPPSLTEEDWESVFEQEREAKGTKQ